MVQRREIVLWGHRKMILFGGGGGEVSYGGEGDGLLTSDTVIMPYALGLGYGNAMA